MSKKNTKKHFFCLKTKTKQKKKQKMRGKSTINLTWSLPTTSPYFYTSGIILELQAQEEAEVSRGEAAKGAPVGIPVATDPIEIQHQ